MLKKIKYRYDILVKLKPYAYGVKRFFLLNFVIGLLIMVLSYVNPIFYKLFINKVILNSQFSEIKVVLAGYFTIFFINAGLGYIKNYSNYRLVNHTTFSVKFKIWKGFYCIPFETYEKQSIGDMKMRLDDDTAQISSFAGIQSIDYIISLFKLIFGVILLFVIEWRLAIFSIFAIPITFIFGHILSKRESILNNFNRNNDEKMSSWLHDSVQGWREIKSLNLQKHEESEFLRYIHRAALYNAKWINYWTARVLVIPKIKDEFLMQFGLYFIGGLLVINNLMNIGNLILFAMYYNILSEAVNSVSSTDSELQGNKPFIDRMVEELVKAETMSIRKGTIPNDSNTIRFRNVCFAYDNNKKVLHNLSFDINNGERVAIIGKSGSGKTTILKLMMGMIYPQKGTVEFAGADLRDINLASLHEKVGYVMQENMLFNTSIRQNLLYGKSNASELEMTIACKKANIYEYIKELPDGYETIIGEKGIKLSGGQKQRIVLARLFLRNVDIFIFDEATSALDQYSENIIRDAINSIAQDKTIIVVAHRESSIRLCDRKIEIYEW